MKISYPLLIDGGLSNVLEDIGCNLNQKLWSAVLLETDPEAIIMAHLRYLEAGAQCIITSSYQASIQGFMASGHDRNSAEAHILKSVELAKVAIERFMSSRQNVHKPLIAASIGPYGALLADGSEYHGDYGVPDEHLKDFHISRIELLDRSGADFFACETIPSYQEAKVIAELLMATEKPAWMSFSCKDEHHLNDGTPIKKCAALLSDHPNVFAISVNCTAPKYISGLIKNLKACSDKKIVIYPNSGELYDPATKSWVGSSDPDLYALMAKKWMELGTDIIGGCCRIGPEHIQSIQKLV